MILYIDESGDLGFDFALPKTTRIFVMTALVCKDSKTDLSITKAVRKTLKNKVAKTTVELKGSNTGIAIKKYFFRHITQQVDWSLYTAIFDKTSWAKRYQKSGFVDQNMFYDEATNYLLKKINFQRNNFKLNMIVDKSKNQEQREIFNTRIGAVFKTLPNCSKTFLEIKHLNSQANPGLQATDLFCWGIRRKYQYKDQEWYRMFADRIIIEAEVKF